MPAGRPSLYRETYPEEAYRLCLLGLTDEELASFFQVHVDTIYEWDKRHPKFSEARARGKAPADAEVAERLYKRAMGYTHAAVKIFQYEGQPVEVPYTEHYPPDTQAASWWLKNRQPAKWKDRQEVTHEVGGSFADMLAEARARRIAAIEAPLIDVTPQDVDVAPQPSGDLGQHGK